MFLSQMRKYKWAIKKYSIEQTQFPMHSKRELAVTATVPIFFWEFILAFTGGLLLVRVVSQTFASFSKEKASLGGFLLRDSLCFLSSADCWQELTWTPLWLVFERHPCTCQPESHYHRPRSCQGSSACRLWDIREDGKVIDRLFSETLKRQKPRLCETRKRGQLETALDGMVGGNSQDGEEMHDFRQQQSS